MRTDEELTEEAAAVFAALYVRYSDQVYRHVRRSLDSDAAAADVTQDVFVKAREELARGGRLPASLRAWVFAIAQQEAGRRQGLVLRPNPVPPENGRAAASASEVRQQPPAATAAGAPNSSEGDETRANWVTAPAALASAGPDRLRAKEDRAAQQGSPPPSRIGRAEAVPMALAAIIASSLIVFLLWNAGREQQPPSRADDQHSVALAVEMLPPNSHQDEQPPNVPGAIQASEASIQISPASGMSPASPALTPAATDPALGAPEPARAAAPTPEGDTPWATIRAPAGFTGANLRAEPSEQGRSLELLANGTPLAVLQGTANADGFSWKHVRTIGGTVGWIVSTALT